jgi:EAL domain-containing protein (putative c-di-GMP-specific phosphodiesterase class I)
MLHAYLAPLPRVAGIGLAIAAVAGAALFLDRLVRTEARLLLQSELAAVAEQAVRSAETPISAAAQALVEIARAGPVDCLSGSTAGLAERARKSPVIVAFDVVDASGFLMCSSADEPAHPARLLPELSPREPSITLAPDPREDRRGLLVAATIANGIRLVAELAPDLPAMPPGPAFAAERISVSLSVTDRGLWRRTGQAADGAADLLTGEAESRIYPVAAKAVVDAGVVPAGFRRIQLAVVACGGLAIGAVLFVGWARRARRHRRATAHAPRATAWVAPLYRPVIEIETGEMVGIDVVLSVEASGNSDFGVLAAEQVLAEMEPVLRGHPGLMLSLPCASARSILYEIAAAVTRLTQKHIIDPRQIVLTASPHAATPEADGAIRASGARLALEGVLSRKGGLMTLATQKPDFITFGSEVLRGQRELAILRAAAEIARKLDVGVVVRDVELPEHIEWLRAVGVTTATGSAFGPELNARSIAELAAAAARATAEERVA